MKFPGSYLLHGADRQNTPGCGAASHSSVVSVGSWTFSSFGATSTMIGIFPWKFRVFFFFKPLVANLTFYRFFLWSCALPGSSLRVSQGHKSKVLMCPLASSPKPPPVAHPASLSYHRPSRSGPRLVLVHRIAGREDARAGCALSCAAGQFGQGDQSESPIRGFPV